MKKTGIFLLLASAFALFGVDASALTVHFDQENGAIKKSLHGSGYMPSITGGGFASSPDGKRLDKDFQAMHFSYCRTHDQALINPGQRIVDTHFVFPRENADASDPENYYFTATDYLLETLIQNGSMPYYRFGTSIEHVASGVHFNTHPPKDAKQYAKILAGIIRHYNYGWANGFKMGIPYWEIWNEPNIGGARMWSGTKEEFVEFFATVLQYLKAEFPNEKIGGPGLTCPDPAWLEPLLAACKKHGIAPDFISYHIYWNDPAVMAQDVKTCRAMLDAAGFPKTEIHLNEWHYLRGNWAELDGEKSDAEYYELTDSTTGMWGIDSAAFNVAMMATFHDVPLDAACYYGAGRRGVAGNFGFFTHTRKKNKNFYSMKMIGEFVTNYPVRVKCESTRPGFYALAALNESKTKGAILIGDYRSNQLNAQIQLEGLKGMKNLHLLRLDQTNDEKEISPELKDGILTLRKENINSAVWLIRFDLAKTN